MDRCKRLFLFATGITLWTAVLSAVAAFGGTDPGRRAIVLSVKGAEVVAHHQLNAVEITESAEIEHAIVQLGPDQSVTSLRQSLAGDANVLAVDEVFVASMTPRSSAQLERRLADLASAGDRSGIVTSPCLAAYVATEVWAGWAEQPAALLANVAQAQAAAGHCGEGVTVAVIDTGVDADHPILAGSILPGYDFLLDAPSTNSEWSGVDASFMAILEESMRATASASYFAILEQSMRQISLNTSGDLNASFMAILETDSISVLLAEEQTETFEEFDLPPLFGHGTMVAGLVRLVAPGAQILPLRAFDGNGAAESSDIVRAIYFAVDQGADVINMSFSMTRQSPSIAEALRYARQHGVVVVAAAGNRSSNYPTYPASDSKVIGVASSDNFDALADFSNYGPNNADLVAPGVAVISSYPGGHYAAGWGTSFSTPLVAGAAALLRFGLPDDATTQREAVGNILDGVDNVNLQGQVLTGGRLDVLGAILDSFDD